VTTDFTAPTEVTGLDMAFGPADVFSLMPAFEAIPEEFKHGRTLWNGFFSDMFFFGVEDVRFTPKVGIDTVKAFNHVQAIARSFQPQHEHKEAACAYLMSLWFYDVHWKPRERAR